MARDTTTGKFAVAEDAQFALGDPVGQHANHLQSQFGTGAVLLSGVSEEESHIRRRPQWKTRTQTNWPRRLALGYCVPDAALSPISFNPAIWLSSSTSVPFIASSAN